ncbi:hypothetical protein D3C79_1097810 [compost metagenome]
MDIFMPKGCFSSEIEGANGANGLTKNKYSLTAPDFPSNYHFKTLSITNKS